MSKPILATIQDRLDQLEHAVFKPTVRLLSKRQLAELEGVSTRTVDRRVADGVYTPPQIENGRCRWPSDNYRRVHATADSAEARAARNPRLRKPV